LSLSSTFSTQGASTGSEPMVYVLNGHAKCPACGARQFKWAPLVEHETAILACSECRHVASLSDARRAGEAVAPAGVRAASPRDRARAS
jgi:Zn ribbon nucleic-acid-binding protein